MLLARSLNLRVEVAHTAVSRLGTMLSTLRLPAKSFSDTSFRSLSTSVNAGAVSSALRELAGDLDRVAGERDGGHQMLLG